MFQVNNLKDDDGNPVDVFSMTEDGLTTQVELDFIRDAARLRDHDEEGFEEVWHLVALLLERLPAAEGMSA